MVEWVLIFTMHLKSDAGTIRDISSEMIGGFTSKAKCEAASKALADRLIPLIGKAREAQGIKKNTSGSSPVIWTDCVRIEK